MSFQWIIDNAESISINRKSMVSSTTARDGTVRSVSRGGQPWRFEVKFPDGAKWTDLRPLISSAEKLDRYTTATIKLNDPGLFWLSQYQGNATNTAFSASWTQGSKTITVSGGTTPSGFKFRAGDFIQLGATRHVYTVAQDVVYSGTSVTLHRPVLDATGSGSLVIGANCQYSVICTQFPEWTIFARDQVSWSGPFIFQEVL